VPLPLVERSKEEITRLIKRKVEKIEEVANCRQINIRMSGKRIEVELNVTLSGNPRLEDTHWIALDIEKAVKSVVPHARVTINTEPVGNNRESLWRLVKEIAEGATGSRGVHNIHIQKIDGKLGIDLHLEVSANMTVKQAHSISEEVESKMKKANPNIAEITVHIESATERVLRELTGVEAELESYIQHVASNYPEIKRVYGIRIRKAGDLLHVVLSCNFDPNIEIRKAHEISSKLEQEIRKAYPKIARIDIHEEPAQ
jgi:divalent metal cation (Fe/Co/Zn/Cd) transporter